MMKVLVVDDEYPARRLLADYVDKTPFLSLIKTCKDVFEAMEVMNKEEIDLLILDIQMPDMNGLEFAGSIEKSPIIIFSTAYSEYALESYELDVADYLLKPVEYPRFIKAAYKAKSIYDNKNTEIVAPLVVSPTNGAQSLEDDFIIVKDGAKLYKINYEDLYFIEGQREYVTFHTTERNITALYSLKELENILSNQHFIRIHKSYIVSIHHIEMLEGNLLTIAKQKLSIGGTYKTALIDMLNKKETGRSNVS